MVAIHTEHHIIPQNPKLNGILRSLVDCSLKLRNNVVPCEYWSIIPHISELYNSCCPQAASFHDLGTLNMVRKLPLPDESLSPVVETLESLGALVRSQRARGQLRIDDAADLLGVSKDLLSRLENGRSVGLDSLMKVLDGLGLKMLVLPKGDASLVEEQLAERAAHSTDKGIA